MWNLAGHSINNDHTLLFNSDTGEAKVIECQQEIDKMHQPKERRTDSIEISKEEIELDILESLIKADSRLMMAYKFYISNPQMLNLDLTSGIEYLEKAIRKLKEKVGKKKNA
jgi:hypothetical protein